MNLVQKVCKYSPDTKMYIVYGDHDTPAYRQNNKDYYKVSTFFLNGLKEPGPIASEFFKLCKILVLEESLYFFHYPWWILQLKMYRLEDINRIVTSYGLIPYLSLHSKA